jgi:predicted nuclease of restriction endonuclease-like (RecB) superfamily
MVQSTRNKERPPYYIDLLFYHRRLRRQVAIELKIGEFEAAHKGLMELYLRHSRACGDPALST